MPSAHALLSPRRLRVYIFTCIAIFVFIFILPAYMANQKQGIIFTRELGHCQNRTYAIMDGNRGFFFLIIVIVIVLVFDGLNEFK
jgi:uncharacterized membrane protein